MFCAAPTNIASQLPNFNVSNLYPNPANNLFSVDYSFEKTVKSAKFDITNALVNL